MVVELDDGQHRGFGECVPYGRYGETVASVMATIEAITPRIAAGLSRAELQRTLPAGAARNALDCAFWALEARQRGEPVHVLAGLPPPHPVVTAYTISIGTPDTMAQAARNARLGRF